MKSADLVVQNGRVLTMDEKDLVLEYGGVVVDQEKIVAVGKMEELSTWKADRVIDASGGVIMPGLVNTHTHLPMSLFRGLADDLPLMGWLNEHIFPAEATHLNPDTTRLGSLLSCAELLLSGTTTLCDGYFFEDTVATAVSDIGMRAVLGQGVIDFPAPGVPDPSENVRHAAEFVEKWHGKSPLITPSIFCHSPYTCSVETLEKAKDAARSKGILFQIHAAETQVEKELIQAEPKMSPVRFLDRTGILDARTLLVHSVWVDDSDMDIIAERKSAVSHNPESNMKLASGIAPVPDLLGRGIIVGLGTDGCASNNNLDLFQEMDSAAKLHKANLLDPTVMDARTVLRMATTEGARAIGLGDAIGTLEPGKQADIIVVDIRGPHMVPLYSPVSHMVYCARGSDVREVVIAGKSVVSDRKLLTLNLEEIIESAISYCASVG